MRDFDRIAAVTLALAGRVLVGATIVLGVLACGFPDKGPGAAPRPNVIFITIDTIRADHCSTYGYERLTTPTLSRVAEVGVVFRNAYAPMATTGPSHATMLTSLYPRTHGFVKNGLLLDPRILTLPEILKDAGYRTAAIVSSFPLAAKFGFDQGFDLFNDTFEGHEVDPTRRKWEGTVVEGYFDQDAHVTTDKASDWLRSQRQRVGPFFLWVHYFDPHSPYRPAESYRRLFLPASGDDPPPGSLEHTVAQYDAEIRETDDAIGRLLSVVEEEGLADSSVLVIAGDHGEGLMQHGRLEHGVHLYEEAVRVPLVFSWPEHLQGGKEVGEPVELVDIFPTLLDMTGLPGNTGIQQGQSLLDTMTGRQKADPDRPVFLERRKYEPQKVDGRFVRGKKLGVRIGPWKYILADEEGTRELFDLITDPSEMTNVVERHPEVAERLSQTIHLWLEQTPTTFVLPDEMVSDEDAKKLEALGYVE